MTDNAETTGPGPDTAASASRGRPPTFTSWLRSRTDAELAALFAERPDLAQPVPADMGALAARATSRNAVLRVLEHLDRFTLQVLEGVVALGGDRGAPVPGVPVPCLAAALGGMRTGPKSPLGRALAVLRRTALVWPDGERLRPVQVLRELLPRPALLGPPVRALVGALPPDRVRCLAQDLGLDPAAGAAPADAVARAFADPDFVDGLIGAAGQDAGRLLESMAWGPPDGTVSDAGRTTSVATAASPVERLIARGLLLPTGESTLTLPQEAGLRLRGGRLFERVETEPPPLEGAERAPADADRAAAGQAFTVIRSVEELLEYWTEDPPGVLRNGGLGVRDLRRTAQRLETDETTAALLIETAHAAGLIAADDEIGGEWLPTRGYDLWRETAPERRWLRLARAWLDCDRAARLGGVRDSGGKVRSILGPDLVRPMAPRARRDALGVLAAAEPGLAPTEAAVLRRLDWLLPRRGSASYTELVRVALAEAADLGLTAAGLLATHTRALLESGADDADDAAAELLAAELPEPLDHVLVQGDLTAVAPGPLVSGLARELALAADVESTGGATVYRFSAESVRRALDAGRGAADLTGLLERHSRTPLPQALRYLIADVGRRHGRLRAGSASGYLRCDEPTVLDELLSDRRTGGLGLFRLAPTVIASRVSRPNLLERLRQLGYHPVAEGGDGTVQLDRAEVRRADAGVRPGTAPAPGPAAREGAEELLRAAVRAVRAGDEAATAARRPVPVPEDTPPRSRATAALNALTRAAAEGQRVWIGYTDTDGRQVSRIVEPARVDGGFLTAYDATRAAVHRFAVHRITGVAELEETPARRAD